MTITGHETIQEMLDQLSEYQAQRSLIEIHKQELIDSVYTPDIKAKLQEIDAEFAAQYEGVDANIASITEVIKSDVLVHGTTVKGQFLMAVYAKGREGGWDSAKLKGFAMAHPEILAAKKPDGDPTVSIRKI